MNNLRKSLESTLSSPVKKAIILAPEGKSSVCISQETSRALSELIYTLGKQNIKTNKGELVAAMVEYFSEPSRDPAMVVLGFHARRK